MATGQDNLYYAPKGYACKKCNLFVLTHREARSHRCREGVKKLVTAPDCISVREALVKRRVDGVDTDDTILSWVCGECHGILDPTKGRHVCLHGTVVENPSFTRECARACQKQLLHRPPPESDDDDFDFRA